MAGAAEEILGKLAKHQGKENSLESLQKSVNLMYMHLYGENNSESIADRANYARNKSKHVDLVKPRVTLDLEEEARHMLTRAIGNYWLVNEDLSPAMERFECEQRMIK